MRQAALMNTVSAPVFEKKSAAFETKDAGDAPADDLETKKAVDNFLGAFEEFKSANDKRLDDIEKKQSDVLNEEKVNRINDALDKQTDQVDGLRKEQKSASDLLKKQADQLDALRLAAERPANNDGNERKSRSKEELEHKQAVIRYIRRGDNENELKALEQKAISVGSDPDGGYTVHAEIDRMIDRILSEVSPIRQIAMVRQISTAVLKKPINVGGTGSGWVGEVDGRPETNTPKLRMREFPAMELYAMPTSTQSALDDSVTNIEEWLANEVEIEFAEQEGAAFVNGDGNMKPNGFIGGYTPVADASFTEAGARPGYIATGASGAFKTTAEGDDVDNVLDLVYSLKSAYRQNASYVMSRTTQRDVRKIKDADGNPTWQPGLQNAQPASLLGYPITEAEDMPAIAANSFSIAFGDFKRGYLIVDRVGVRILRDPFTAKPNILFYTTKRVGGGIQLFEAIKLLKFGAS